MRGLESRINPSARANYIATAFYCIASNVSESDESDESDAVKTRHVTGASRLGRPMMISRAERDASRRALTHAQRREYIRQSSVVRPESRWPIGTSTIVIFLLP
jgi:hypothetical protein